MTTTHSTLLLKFAAKGKDQLGNAWLVCLLATGTGSTFQLNAQTTEALNPTAAEQFKALLASPSATETFMFKSSSLSRGALSSSTA